MFTEGQPILTRNRDTSRLLPLLGISLLLSMLSVYTIYKGMTSFTGHAVIAVIIATGIQSMVFVTAWRLGFMLKNRMPSVRRELIAFLVYFSLSATLSFVGLLDTVFPEPRQEQARLARVHDGVTEIIASAGNKARTYQGALVRELVSSPDFTAWSNRVTAVADLASESRDRLVTAIAESIARRRGQADRLAADATEVAATEKALDRRLRTESASLLRLDGLRESLIKETVSLKSRLREANAAVAKLQERASGEDRDEGNNAKPQGGEVRNRLGKERQRLIDQIAATDRLLTQKTQRLKALEAERQTLEARSAQTRDELKAIGDRRAAIEGAAQEARRKLATPGAITGLDLGHVIQSLREVPAKFADTQDTNDFARVIEMCNDLLGTMWTVPALVPKLTGLSCDPGPVLNQLEAIDIATTAIDTLDRDCLPGGKNARAIDTLSFNDSLNHALGCLETARLPEDSVRSEHRDIERLARNEAPGTPLPVRAKNALFRGDGWAVVTLFIAMAINLLVLLAGFFASGKFTSDQETPVELAVTSDESGTHSKYATNSPPTAALALDEMARSSAETPPAAATALVVNLAEPVETDRGSVSADPDPFADLERLMRRRD